MRLHVAMAKLGNALGVELDPKRPDHELLEQLAERAIALAVDAKINEPPPVYKLCACSCPSCTRSGDA